MDSYTPQEADWLLSLARRVLELSTQQPGGAEPRFRGVLLTHFQAELSDLPPALMQPRACFVTLQTRPKLELRGCTGTLVARMPLAEEVIHSTHQTAFGDPRFPPVSAAEVPNIQIEISVLTPSEPLAYTDAADLLRKLRPGVDGVTLSSGKRRATFLPQVWESLPNPYAFLGALCNKMGLPSDAWQSGKLEVSTYQAVKLIENPK